MKKVWFASLVVLSCSVTLQAQVRDSLLLHDPLIAEFDSLLNSEDSLYLLQLINSIIISPDMAFADKSQMALRLGYNSNVVAASRTLGINQFGLAPGVSFYHKSGLYADATGHWSSEYDPNYYLTVLSGGYLKTVGKHWSFLAEYSHYFYSDQGNDASIPYTNNIGMSNFLEFGPFNFRLDYSLYFGEKTAHRITPGVFLNLEKRNWHGFRRIAFFPSFNLLFGSEIVTTYTSEARAYTTNPIAILYRIKNNLPLRYTYYLENNSREFGMMNYSLAAPVSVSWKNWTFLVSYVYNFPKALKGEELSVTDGGYLSFSITRNINFK